MDQSGIPSLEWRDGVPVSIQFDDPYFSLNGGLAEAQHVFLAGNALPVRFTEGFHIGELGFGTGLNMLAAWAAWDQSGATGALKFTSFEAYPMSKPDMETALSHFGEVASYAQRLLDVWKGPGQYDFGSLSLDLIAGDANQMLPRWTGKADAWFLDGFNPAKNPEMWHPDLLACVASHTAPSGTFATYSAAGPVRRALETAGFSVIRAAGFAGKRHMTRGALR